MCLVRTKGVPRVQHKYLGLLNVKRGLAKMQISPLQGSRVTSENDSNLICNWAYHRVSMLYVLLKVNRTKALMFCLEHSRFRVGLPNETSQKDP
jgi:hypothetical protein